MQWHDASRSDVMAKEINGVTSAFGNVDNHAIVLKSLEEQVKVLFMCLGILAGHQNIVYINEGEI